MLPASAECLQSIFLPDSYSRGIDALEPLTARVEPLPVVGAGVLVFDAELSEKFHRGSVVLVAVPGAVGGAGRPR